MKEQKMRRGFYRTGRTLLASNQQLFIRVYDRFDARSRPQSSPVLTDASNPLNRVVQDLHRDGFARWPGLFSGEDFLKEARKQTLEALSLSTQAFESSDGRRVIRDLKRQWEFWRGIDPNDGRTRTMIPNDTKGVRPSAIQKVMEDSRLQQVVDRYYGQVNKAWCKYVLCEQLHQTPVSDVWHFDKLFDQIKVMILLSDVGPENGPIRYKLGTHRRPKQIDHFYYHTFRSGLDFAYPPKPMVDQLPGEVVLGTGQAGDCLFFDTLGIHSGTPCLKDDRLILVSAFNVSTLKNNILYQMMFG